ncbi:MAG: prepilin-type N-terminal cleavage/methylation domain-containing protein [Myxococcota bacterium]|nr:prepilin-type N-terminal cleavage/methylation domain-containing protein [Myxococcota bacterium]
MAAPIESLRPRSLRTRPRHASAGFTLLEVLAAMAVFALVYTVLLTAVSQGLILEGDAQRRMEASLLADRALAQAAARIREEGAGRPSEEEEEVELFSVATRIAALDPDAIGLDLVAPPTGTDSRETDRGRDALGRRGGGTRVPQGPSLLQPSTGAGNLALVSLEVTVSWQEGAETQAVRRDSIVFSPEGAAPLLANLVDSLPDPDADAEGGLDGEDEDAS